MPLILSFRWCFPPTRVVGQWELFWSRTTEWDAVLSPFFSQTLNIHEQRYTIRERELLAIVKAIRHWRCSLHGRSFDVLTDHESLPYLKTQDKLNDQHVRWLDVLEQ